MQRLTYVTLAATTLLAASACGGDSNTTFASGGASAGGNGQGNNAGSTNNGGSATGGGNTGGSATGGGATGGSATGGESSGGAGTGGSGGISDMGFACGDNGLMCAKAQLCVQFVVTAGPTNTITWECHTNPCGDTPVSCMCAGTICSGSGPGSGCSVMGDVLVCQSGGICASPDTRIATPSGERAISELHEGDLVMSRHQGELVAVPLLRATRTEVFEHAVVELSLSNHETLRISAPHPTADGRTFAELLPGSMLDGHTVLSVATLPYAHAHTYDILPDSDSGAYIAGGVLIGSTLK